MQEEKTCREREREVNLLFLGGNRSEREDLEFEDLETKSNERGFKRANKTVERGFRERETSRPSSVS